MTQTEYELYEQWREDYALMYEPNYDEHLEADCKAAFLAGMKAAHHTQEVQMTLEQAQQSMLSATSHKPGKIIAASGLCAHQPPAEQQVASRVQAVPQWLIDKVVPEIDPVGLDPEKHHCEYALYQDRERIRRELAAAGY